MEEMNNTTDLSAQIKKIADHLVFLEKKLDTLLEQSKNRRPFNQGFGGDRPYRSNRPNHSNGGYPSKHSGNYSGYAGQGGQNRYAGNRDNRDNRGNRAEHGNGGYQKKYAPHRGNR